MWKHFSHPADVGVIATADNLNDAFAEAAVALTAVITEPKNVQPAQSVQIKIAGENEEDLFFKWMSKIIFEMDVRKMLFGKYEVKIKDSKLSAVAYGEKVNFEKHSPAVEPKAVTLNQLCVRKENDKWICQCVIDV